MDASRRRADDYETRVTQPARTNAACGQGPSPDRLGREAKSSAEAATALTVSMMEEEVAMRAEEEGRAVHGSREAVRAALLPFIGLLFLGGSHIGIGARLRF